MKYSFRAFGLNIQSDFPFRAFECPEKGNFDLQIIQKSKLEIDFEPDYKGVHFLANEENFYLNVPDVAQFWAQKGKQIYIEVHPKAQTKEVELFCMGSVMAAILLQRGIIPLHGAAFENNGKASIITGISGAGKSTLLNYFLSRGFRFITDDVSALSVIDSKVYVQPSYPSSKLWSDVMNKYAFDTNKYEQLRPSVSKYKKDCTSFVTEPIEVADVYILSSKNKYEFSCQEYIGFEKLIKYQANLYRPKFSQALSRQKETYTVLQQLAAQTQLFTLERSNSFKMFDAFNEYAYSKIVDKK